jgi:biotin transport system substrate-specific component
MRPAAMARIALMAALTAVMAQIAVPIEPVPFTFQVLAVILAGYLLGPRYGAMAMLVYLLLGAVGVPVFANFTSGLGTLLGPSGGYLWSYPLAAAVAGLAAPALAGSRRPVAMVWGVGAGALALVVIYAVGAFWLAVQANLSPGATIAAGVAPFVVFDAVKVAFATVLAAAVAPRIAFTRLFVGPASEEEGRVR